MNRREFIATTGGAAAVALSVSGCTKEQKSDTVRALAEIPSVITTSGSFTGIYLVFEGLLVFSIPKSAGSVKVGLLEGDHVPTLRLPRGALLPVQGSDVAAKPSTITYWHVNYNLRGMRITVEPEITSAPLAVTWALTNGPRKGCPKDAKDWRDLRWALDLRRDLGVTAKLNSTWLDAGYSSASFNLTTGDVDSYIANFNHHPVIEKYAAILNDDADPQKRTRKPIKAAIGYRVDQDAVIKLRLTAANGTSTVIRIDGKSKNGKGQLVTGNVTNFLADLMPLPVKDGLLTETSHYAHVLDTGGAAVKTPYWSDISDTTNICNSSASIECGCCPPGVYPEP